MDVLIKKTSSEISLPAYQSKGAAGFDFAASETTIVEPKSCALIPTGLVIKVPEHFFLMISARSSLARKKNLMLANGVGIIDSDYCGENDVIYISVYNFSETQTTIEKGERIANGIFLPVSQISWQETEHMNTENRGGFGSTG